MQHLFFHGPSGAGKSFAIARAAAEAGVTPAGFRSRKAADGAVYLGPAAGPFPLDAAHRVANVAVRPPVCAAARYDALGAALHAPDYDGPADFVINRTNDPAVARRIASQGVRVLKPAAFCALANDKDACYLFLAA